MPTRSQLAEQASSVVQAPWMRPDLFPQHTAGYGYTKNGTFHRSTREGLIDEIAFDRWQQISSVGIPESPWELLPEEVPFLAEAATIRARFLYLLQLSLLIAFIAIWGFGWIISTDITLFSTYILFSFFTKYIPTFGHSLEQIAHDRRFRSWLLSSLIKLRTWQFLLFGLALILFIIVLRILIPFNHPLNGIIQIAGLEVTSSTGWADGWRYATGLFFTTSSAVLYCLILMLLPCVLLLSRVWHILLVPIPFVVGVLVAVLIDRWLGFVSINTSLYGLTGMLGGLGWYAITGPTKQIPTLRWVIGLVMMMVVAIGYSTMMPGMPFGLLGGFAGGFVVVAGLVSTTQNTYPHRPTRAEQLVGWLSYGLIGVAGILLLWRIATI